MVADSRPSATAAHRHREQGQRGAPTSATRPSPPMSPPFSTREACPAIVSEKSRAAPGVGRGSRHAYVQGSVNAPLRCRSQRGSEQAAHEVQAGEQGDHRQADRQNGVEADDQPLAPFVENHEIQGEGREGQVSGRTGTTKLPTTPRKYRTRHPRWSAPGRRYPGTRTPS
jgi:hypothetical protein